MLYVIPETDSPITHCMSSSDKKGGILASIILKRPESFFYEDWFDEDEEIVYLTSSNEAEFFDPLFDRKEKALVMTIGVYLNILKFMQETWPKTLKEIKDKIMLLQDQSYPFRLGPNMTLSSNGRVVFERWFDTCFFHYFESSNDLATKKRKIHLQIENKSIQVEPDVLYNLSFQYEKLLNVLTRAGYIYRGPISENLQF